MSKTEEKLELGGFAGVLGDRERSPESIEGLTEILATNGLAMGLGAMGCGSFWQMTGPLETYVVECVSQTLAKTGVAPKDVDHIVFATSDSKLRLLDESFARTILERVGLVECTPSLISLQQCASSVTALDYAVRRFEDPAVDHAVIVAFDFVVEEKERIRPFALFSDAVSSCIVSRAETPRIRPLTCGVDVDFAGFVGRDGVMARKRVAVRTIEAVLGRHGVALGDVAACFSTNFYKPVALFNANICGIGRAQLCIDTLATYGHCGNCDWMLNLMHRQSEGSLVPGKYLAQAFAPGFFACALLDVAT